MIYLFSISHPNSLTPREGNEEDSSICSAHKKDFVDNPCSSASTYFLYSKCLHCSNGSCGLQTIPPTDPHIKYVGRWDTSSRTVHTSYCQALTSRQISPEPLSQSNWPVQSTST